MANPKYLRKLAEEQAETIVKMAEILDRLEVKVNALGRMLQELKDGSNAYSG